jgi:lysophospholipase L1-like esterase
MNILIFGDSIARGLWDENGGWPEKVKKSVHSGTVEEEYYREVYNLGVSGDTSFDLLNRFEEELKRRVSEDPAKVIFQVGLNDTQIENRSGKHVTPKETFRGNLRELVARSDRLAEQAYFLGLTPVDESKVDPIPWRETHSYRNQSIQKYDNVVRCVVQRSSARYIPLFGRLKDHNWSDQLWEGVHPNTDGHERIFEIVKDEIEFV